MFKYKYNYIYIIYIVLIILLLFLSTKFSNLKEYKHVNLELIKTDFSKLPGWQESLRVEAVNSFINSCEIIKKTRYDAEIFIASKIFSLNPYKIFCQELKIIKNKKQLKKLIENYFDPYLFNNEDAKFTGYIELTLKGRKIKNKNIAPNAVPILKTPNELLSIDLSLFNKNYEGTKLKAILKNKEIIPFPSRKEIENSNKFHEDVLVYVDDPAMAFFLHVQGSGRVILPDGDVMYLGYSDNNGKEYTSIGQELVKNKVMKLEDVSMHSLLKWMRENKNEADYLMHLNERYIFFKERKNNLVLGSSKSNLEAMHSVAVDNKYIPFHTPIWVEISSFSKENNLYRGLFLAHDTGAAIKGPLRFDLFLGSGNDKELVAGSLNSNGKAWFLLPKNIR